MSSELKQLKNGFNSVVVKTVKIIFLVWLSMAILTGIPILIVVGIYSGLDQFAADRTLYCYHTVSRYPNCQIERVDWLNQTTLKSINSVEKAVTVRRYSDPVKRRSDRYYHLVLLIRSQDLTSSGGYGSKTLSMGGDLPGVRLKSFNQDEGVAANQFVNQINTFVENRSPQSLTRALDRGKPKTFLLTFLGIVYVLPFVILFCLSCAEVVLALIKPYLQ